MSHYQLRCEMIVPKPIGEVFAMFENPYNLGLITPPWLRFRVVSAERVHMELGAIINYRLQWLGLPLRWRTRITSYLPPDEFVDEAVRGPYKFWRHRHTFEAVEGGTRICDAVDYALPFGALGRLSHWFAVKRNLIAIFTFRQRALNRYWGCGARIIWPTVQVIESQPSPLKTASPGCR